MSHITFIFLYLAYFLTCLTSVTCPHKSHMTCRICPSMCHIPTLFHLCHTLNVFSHDLLYATHVIISYISHMFSHVSYSSHCFTCLTSLTFNNMPHMFSQYAITCHCVSAHVVAGKDRLPMAVELDNWHHHRIFYIISSIIWSSNECV